MCNLLFQPGIIWHRKPQAGRLASSSGRAKNVVVLVPEMAPPSVGRDGETLDVSNIKRAAAVRSKDGKEGQQKGEIRAQTRAFIQSRKSGHKINVSGNGERGPPSGVLTSSQSSCDAQCVSWYERVPEREGMGKNALPPFTVVN
ncbi:hypothetical protein QQF64_028147 [Cirrhinus molitorella]|uniref:Uncharacterized protein n=1 Tax=Cirrhinus molitorella TaxID=172907 RepID=A0ABR3N5U3_9TELE